MAIDGILQEGFVTTTADKLINYIRTGLTEGATRRDHLAHARLLYQGDERREADATLEDVGAGFRDDTGFIAGCLGEPQVQECHHVTGDWSYLLKVRARHTADLERLIGHTIKTWPGVVRTRTTLALSSPKETAALPCAAAVVMSPTLLEHISECKS